MNEWWNIKLRVVEVRTKPQTKEFTNQAAYPENENSFKEIQIPLRRRRRLRRPEDINALTVTWSNFSEPDHNSGSFNSSNSHFVRQFAEDKQRQKRRISRRLIDEGRGVRLATNDWDEHKLGMLGRLALNAGFDYVEYKAKDNIYASVKSGMNFELFKL